MKIKSLNTVLHACCTLLGLMLFQYTFAQNTNWSVLTPKLAGTLKLGVINGNESKWFSDFFKIKEKSNSKETIYTIKDHIIGNGKIELIIRSLTDSKGNILKVNFTDIPANTKLIWAYGGASNKKTDAHNWIPNIKPNDCYQNVFSIEGNSFTLYYGTSRHLKILEALTPPPSSHLRLSDAYRQNSPIDLLRSNKSTSAQILTANVIIPKSESLYFCFYFLSPKADYNYFMLPKLFEKGSYRVNDETEWMKSTPD